ncbi:hypothetical protein ISCGN_007093 [Ixodes scapularis]
MLARTRVAALHFNENSDREQAISGAGQRQWKRKSPKAKKGHPTVAEEKTKATHAYVAKLLAQAVLICEEIAPLREVFKRDREMPRLPYMSESFERPPKEDLVAARISRFGKRVPVIAE